MTTSIQSSLRAAIRAEISHRAIVPALVVAGGCFAAGDALALELGDASVNSGLGQPLQATIPYVLGPNEQLFDACVTLVGGPAASGLPPVTRARIGVGAGTITVTGSAAVSEPLMSMRVRIDCPYTPRLTRDFMLFINPAQPATSAAPAAAALRDVPAPVAATVATRPARPTVTAEPVSVQSRYRVQPGDSLSQIVQRIENRSVGLWPAVNAIFAANPEAFIDNDPNRLKAGSWLTIPDLADTGAEFAADIAEPGATPAATEQAAETTAGSSAYDFSVSRAAELAAESEAAADEFEATDNVAPAPAAAESTSVAPLDFEAGQAETAAADASTRLEELQPGDVIIESDNPFVGLESSVIIADTELPGPETASTSPNVPVAVPRAPAEESSSGGLLWWIVGGGLALIGGLLYLSQRVRTSFGSTPIAPAATPRRRKTDSDTQRLETAGELDMYIADDSPTEENLALDADLIRGTGLSDTADIDVAPDFGFAATTQIDIELPDEMSATVTESPETDIIPPLNASMESILESEVMPEDDEYDMSVIVDATKMPQPEDVTERDLGAIELDADDEPLIDSDYTVSQEVDYKILEQDYEDELTATQALNQEIARAAAELAGQIDAEDAKDDNTAEISMASVTALDLTEQLPANDDTEVLELETDDTVNFDADEQTARLPADDEATAEMPVKRGSKSA